MITHYAGVRGAASRIAGGRITTAACQALPRAVGVARATLYRLEKAPEAHQPFIEWMAPTPGIATFHEGAIKLIHCRFSGTDGGIDGPH